MSNIILARVCSAMELCNVRTRVEKYCKQRKHTQELNLIFLKHICPIYKILT